MMMQISNKCSLTDPNFLTGSELPNKMWTKCSVHALKKNSYCSQRPQFFFSGEWFYFLLINKILIIIILKWLQSDAFGGEKCRIKVEHVVLLYDSDVVGSTHFYYAGTRHAVSSVTYVLMHFMWA